MSELYSVEVMRYPPGPVPAHGPESGGEVDSRGVEHLSAHILLFVRIHRYHTQDSHREADVGGRPLAAPHPVVGGAGVHSVMVPGHAT